METLTVTTTKKVISDKSAKAQRLINNANAKATLAEIKAAGAASDIVADLEADIYDSEIAKLEKTVDKKAQAALEKLQAKEAKLHIAAEAKVKASADKLQVKLLAKEQAAKEREANYVPSAFGTAITFLCDSPQMTFKELKAKVETETGITGKDGAIRTAFSQANHIFKLLRKNNLMK